MGLWIFLLFVWKRLIFSLRLFSPCLPSRERWRHVRDNKWKYISKSIDVVYRGPSTRLLLVTSFEYLDLTFRSLRSHLIPAGARGEDDKVCARRCPQSNRWPTLWTFIDLLYSVWLSSDPILPIVYPLYVYILAPLSPLPKLLFSIPFDVLWRTHKFGSLTVNGQTVGSHLFLALILMGPT